MRYSCTQSDSIILLREQPSFLLPRGLQEHQTPADATDGNSHRLPFVWCAHIFFSAALSLFHSYSQVTWRDVGGVIQQINPQSLICHISYTLNKNILLCTCPGSRWSSKSMFKSSKSKRQIKRTQCFFIFQVETNWRFLNISPSFCTLRTDNTNVLLWALYLWYSLHYLPVCCLPLQSFGCKGCFWLGICIYMLPSKRHHARCL